MIRIMLLYRLFMACEYYYLKETKRWQGNGKHLLSVLFAQEIIA